MLGNAAIVQSVVAVLEAYPRIFTVLDPVLVASSGAALLDAAGREFMNTALIPLVDLVTPNLDEASKLELKNAAASLVKGGHGAEVQCVDRLQIGQEAPIELSCARIVTSNNRGTGCALSSSYCGLYGPRRRFDQRLSKGQSNIASGTRPASTIRILMERVLPCNECGDSLEVPAFITFQT